MIACEREMASSATGIAPGGATVRRVPASKLVSTMLRPRLGDPAMKATPFALRAMSLYEECSSSMGLARPSSRSTITKDCSPSATRRATTWRGETAAK